MKSLIRGIDSEGRAIYLGEAEFDMEGSGLFSVQAPYQFEVPRNCTLIKLQMKLDQFWLTIPLDWPSSKSVTSDYGGMLLRKGDILTINFPHKVLDIMSD